MQAPGYGKLSSLQDRKGSEWSSRGHFFIGLTQDLDPSALRWLSDMPESQTILGVRLQYKSRGLA